MPIPPSLNSSETNPKRIKLIVAYDGFDFFGWAFQPDQRTVCGVLRSAIEAVSSEKVELVGASRTDSGAHAIGQVCHFDTTRAITLSNWIRALNDQLPPDLSVIKALVVHPQFHSRFWAYCRRYRYRILTGARDPHRARYSHYYGRPLDVAKMHEAAQKLVGEHDFLAFTQQLEEGERSVREIFSISVRQSRDEVWIDVAANAYARGMMRRISGALWEIGRGSREPEMLDVLLQQREKDQVHWPIVLPAEGLCLMKIHYPKGIQKNHKYGIDREDQN